MRRLLWCWTVLALGVTCAFGQEDEGLSERLSRAETEAEAQQIIEGRNAQEVAALLREWQAMRADQREILAAFMGDESSKAIQAGNATRYAYEPGVTALLTCVPMRTCTISLVPGERPTLVILGDAIRWWMPDGEVEDAFSQVGEGKNARYVVPLRPTLYDLGTNLTIGTDAGRLYVIELNAPTEAVVKKMLGSGNGSTYQNVEFYDPKTFGYRVARAESFLAAGEAKHQAQRATTAERKASVAKRQLALHGPLDAVNFNCSVKGKEGVYWRPEQVFQDLSHTFIRFSSYALHRERPALLVREGEEYSAIVPQVEGAKGEYYVVPALFDEARLVLGSGGKAQTMKIKCERG